MNRKPRRKKTSFRLLLLGMVLTPFLMPGNATPIVKADYIGDCGEPYVVTTENCWGWPGWIQWCSPTQQACTKCDGGTFCYNMY